MVSAFSFVFLLGVEAETFGELGVCLQDAGPSSAVGYFLKKKLGPECGNDEFHITVKFLLDKNNRSKKKNCWNRS